MFNEIGLLPLDVIVCRFFWFSSATKMTREGKMRAIAGGAVVDRAF